jgi:hypothetical protein
MRRGSRGAALAAIATVLLLSACGGAVSDEHVVEEPVTVEQVLGRVTLTEEASRRLDIRTAKVLPVGERLAIPSSAWFVQPDGTYLVYTNPEPLVFLRHQISVEADDGRRTLLTSGPPAGTRVVTVGVPELLGAEFEIGH